MKIQLDPGPFAHFSEYEMVKALLEINKRPLGRAGIMHALALGEGSTRTLMNKLKEIGLVKSSTKGLVLSEEGKQFVKNILKMISGPARVKFIDHSVALRIKKSAEKIKYGIEQRDAAVKAGADGALVLVRGKSGLRIAGSRGFRKENESLYEEIERKLSPEEGDVIIIVFSKNLVAAESGAWAAAKTIV